MLEITIPKQELWDERNSCFISIKGQTLRLEHSLVSLSKWESKWCKPFMSKEPKSYEEELDYIKCMTLTQNVDSNIYNYIPESNMQEIREYINAPMTATTFREDSKSRADKEIVTAEIIYYWMIALNIPTEFQKWHLNKLLTLIRVCNIKNQPDKKMSTRDVIARQKAINEANKRKFKTKG